MGNSNYIQINAARDFLLGLNQKEIAAKYGVHWNTIGAWIKAGLMASEITRLREMIRRLP